MAALSPSRFCWGPVLSTLDSEALIRTSPTAPLDRVVILCPGQEISQGNSHGTRRARGKRAEIGPSPICGIFTVHGTPRALLQNRPPVEGPQGGFVFIPAIFARRFAGNVEARS